MGRGSRCKQRCVRPVPRASPAFGQDLQRDIALQLGVARNSSDVHPTVPKQRDDFVRPQFRTGTQHRALRVRWCMLSYSMVRSKIGSTVLTLRVPAALGDQLGREARRRRQTRSQVARHILEAGLGAGEPDLVAEARRQSLLVSRRSSERDALAFVLKVGDTTRWR